MTRDVPGRPRRARPVLDRALGRVLPLALALALALPLALGSGCAGAGGAGRGAAAGPAARGAGTAAGPVGYVRRIAPFPVLGPDGEPYTYPFLGGLNIPRPQFVDIDADGDLDLFVQERSGEVMFFENRSGAGAADDGGAAGAGAARGFVWRTDRFQDLDVGEWFRFVDLDADGDPDLLAEQPFSLIRYFRNDGGRFVAAADTLRDAAGEPLFSDRQNIPNVTDIDCDGRPDLFVGKLTGTVTRYEATAPVGAVPPPFALVTERFEDIRIVNTLGASAHGANTMVFADVDADGDQDLFWGDFFEPGILLIQNTGSCEAPSLRGEPVPFPRGDPVRTSGFNVPAVADLDGDGDFDVLLGVLGGAYNPSTTASDNLYLLENTGGGAGAARRGAGGGYAVRTRRFLDGIDLGAESVVEAGDVDGDGDEDLLVAAKLDPAALSTSRVVLFENTGSATRPAFRLADTLDIGGSYHFAPELADLDADGDLDLLLGTWNDGVLIAWNEGDAHAPRWVPADEPLITLTRGSHTVPAAADIDGDGDLDLVIGEAVGALNLYRNVGSPTRPRFELVSDEYGGFDVGRRSAPAFTDLDGDGDPDLVVGHEDGGPVCFRNGGGEFEAMDGCPLPALLPNATPRFADLDGDGDLDLLAGSLGGGVVYYENRLR